MSIDLGTISASLELRLGQFTPAVGASIADIKRLSKTIDEETAKSTRSLSLLSNSFGKFAASESGRKIARDMTLAGGATVAALGAATKAAADFDQALRNVDSIAHLTAAQFGELHDSVLSLSKDPSIRQAPTDLAKGLYDVYSSGFAGKQAMDILKVSAQGASAGMTDTATSSKALMAVLNSGIPGVQNARQAMDVLFQEVNYGVNTFEELASSIGTSLPIAAKAGITLQELTAAIGVMTRQGISASESVTELQQFILHLINPGQQAAKVMDELGIKHGLAAVKAEGLAGAIQNVMEKTKGHEDSLAHLFPRIESFIGFLAIAKNSGKDFADALDQEKHAGDGVGQMMEALLRQNKGAAAQTEILKKRVAELAIKIGEDLLPYMIKLVDDTEKLIDKFESLPKPLQDGIVKFTALAGIITVLGGGFLSAAANLVVLRNGLVAAGLLGGAGAGSAAGAAGILGRLGLMSGSFGFGGAMGTAGLGGNLIGGGVLAAPAMFAGYMANKIMGAQNEGYDAQQRGLGVADLSPYLNKMAAIRKAHPKDYEGRKDYQQEQDMLRRMSGETGRERAGGSGPLADAMAKHIGERTGIECGAAVTKALRESGFTGTATALAKAAVASQNKQLRPDAAGHLPPGTIVFFPGKQGTRGIGSDPTEHFGIMGGISATGHQSVLESTTAGGLGRQYRGDRGLMQIAAQHGGKFYAFAAPGAKAASGAGAGTGGLSDDQKQKLSDQAKFSRDIQDQLYEATHPEFANRRHKALRDYQDQLADPDATKGSKGDARKLYLATIAQINADERKANSDHLKELLRQWKEYLAEQVRAAKDARDARLRIQQEANGRSQRLGDLSADMTDSTNALTQDPEEYSFAKQGEEAAKRLRQRQDAIRANQTFGPYGKNDIDPGVLLKQAQGEYDAAMAHIDQLRQAKKQKDQEQAAEEAQRIQDKTDRENEAADRAQARAEQGIEETMRFEYEHQMISLAQYQAFLQEKLASLDKFEQDADGKDTPTLTENWKRVKGDLDSTTGQKKQKTGEDPFGWLGDGMKNGVGQQLEHFHSLKSAVKDWEAATIAAITHVAAMWATASLFGSKFGGGFNFGSGLFGGSGKGAGPLSNSLTGINGPVGGGIGGLLGSLGSLIPGGGLFGGLLGGLFGGKSGGLFGGLKKIFHFSGGGLVPGVGFHDSVPAMLTPGEVVIPRGPGQRNGGGSMAPPITINHYGDVNSVEDVHAMHSAWATSQAFATAVPGT